VIRSNRHIDLVSDGISIEVDGSIFNFPSR
jgi:hypothetical protein